MIIDFDDFSELQDFLNFFLYFAIHIFCSVLCVYETLNECQKVVSIETKTYAETRHLPRVVAVTMWV